ncbi:MAG TPA: lipocalin family protein [Flavitalea sp.]|nr:lipocalin family protein [Flavitalea sp.]
MYRKLMIFSLCIAVLASCSKNDDNDKEPTPSQLLTNVAWKYDNAGIDANGDGTIDTALPDGTIEDCDKDNTYTFMDDGTGTMDEGATKCDGSSPQTVPFNYSLNSNGTVINFPDTVISGISGDVSIKKLTATQLVLSKSIEIGIPIPVTVVVELKH